jgi:hypothetical protein
MTNHKHSLEQKMNSSRTLPWLAGAAIACALLAAPAARAQTITSSPAAPTSGVGGTGLAKAAPVSQVGLIGGTTTTPLPSTTAPEPVGASGSGTTTATVSVDPNGGSTVVELYADLSKVIFTGSKSLQKYFTTGQVRATRILAASDSYQATMPLWTTNAAGKTTYYTMTATFNMTFNTTTNVMTGISVALGDYVAPATAGSTAVGGTIQ